MAGGPLSHDAVIPMDGTTATAVVWRALDRLYVTAIAKATFAFADEAFMSRIEPEKILTAEVHHGKNPARSVRFTNDLAPYLARADVVFTGFAHALPGGPVRSLPVRFAIQTGDRSSLDKRLLVQDASGFHRLAVTYERAWGGVDCLENPLGVGAVAGTGEPNIVDPANPKMPAGFAPVGRLWPARKRLLGSTSRKVLEGPIAEIPDGFDWSYFQAGPQDQRIDYLRGDEWVLLEGLHPTLARIRMHLPRVQAFARVLGLAAFGVPDGQMLPLNADTLRVDGEHQRCTLVFRASFAVPDATALAGLRIMAGVESWGVPIVWRAPPAARARLSTRPPAPAPPAAEDAKIADRSDIDLTIAQVRPDALPRLTAAGTIMIDSSSEGSNAMVPALPPGVSASHPQMQLLPPSSRGALPSRSLPPPNPPSSRGFDPKS